MIRQPLTKVEIALNQQRLTGEFCDVTIFCGTEVRFAHRCVIASASEAWDFWVLVVKKVKSRRFGTKICLEADILKFESLTLLGAHQI